MSHHSRLQSPSQLTLISALVLATLGSSLLSAAPVAAGQKVTIRRVILAPNYPNAVIYSPSQLDPLFLSPAIASPNFPSFPNGYGYGGYGGYGCFHPCIAPYPAVGGGGYNVINGSVVDSTLVNPVVVNSPIYNSTLVNPVIIQKPRYRPGVRGSFSISF
jgi:hypothetical protein